VREFGAFEDLNGINLPQEAPVPCIKARRDLRYKKKEIFPRGKLFDQVDAYLSLKLLQVNA
jgi:hypothetical protein